MLLCEMVECRDELECWESVDGIVDLLMIEQVWMLLYVVLLLFVVVSVVHVLMLLLTQLILIL